MNTGRSVDFGATPEPQGASNAQKKGNGSLIYAVQKHMASHLHYDFRLEWRGVLLSWAVPKGPSLDPAVKRLAMQTEDHPVEYSDFEGVIPAGQYGAGTVMLWDRGTWQPESADVDSSLQKGEIKFTLHGKKLQGSWVLVRTRGFGKNPARSAWLLIKHRDQYASTKDVTQEEPRSVASRRLLADIARDEGGDIEKASKGDPAGKGRRDNEREVGVRTHPSGLNGGQSMTNRIPFRVQPMLATLVSEPFDRPGWVYEEKYDGDRILAYKEGDRVRLLSRNGKDRTDSFPRIAASHPDSQTRHPASRWRGCCV